jgi:hypothetical protein
MSGRGNLTRRGKGWRFKFEVSANPRVTKYHMLYGTKKQAQGSQDRRCAREWPIR